MRVLTKDEQSRFYRLPFVDWVQPSTPQSKSSIPNNFRPGRQTFSHDFAAPQTIVDQAGFTVIHNKKETKCFAIHIRKEISIYTYTWLYVNTWGVFKFIFERPISRSLNATLWQSGFCRRKRRDRKYAERRHVQFTTCCVKLKYWSEQEFPNKTQYYHVSPLF